MRRHHPLKTKAAPGGAANFATGSPFRASAPPAGQPKTNKGGAEQGQGGRLRNARGAGGCRGVVKRSVDLRAGTTILCVGRGIKNSCWVKPRACRLRNRARGLNAE